MGRFRHHYWAVGRVVFALAAVFFPSLNQSGSLYWLLYNNISSYALLLIPLSLFIAILRYRLWDIDNLINRALVYGTLTFLLALTTSVSLSGN